MREKNGEGFDEKFGVRVLFVRESWWDTLRGETGL